MRTLQKSLLLAAAGLAATGIFRGLARQSRWFNFADKVAIVTGGSRGLGLVIARELVARRARVAICARTKEDLDDAAAELRDRGGDVLSLVCDIRDQGQVQSMVAKVIAAWGRVDVLFNVAGVIDVGPFDAMTLDNFHNEMATNCWGPLHTTLAVLPHMRRRRWGRIVNVASIGGKQAVPHLLPYDVSKFALVGLSNGLRTELAKEGILVTTACPTLMRTGSPRNAEFKGYHRLEYAWFSLGSALPVVSMSAVRAAQQILRACQYGDGEVFITNLLNPPVLATWFAPQLTNDALALINRFLPPMGGLGQQSARGYESESMVAPSPLTALGEQAAAANNQLRPRRTGAD